MSGPEEKADKDRLEDEAKDEAPAKAEAPAEPEKKKWLDNVADLMLRGLEDEKSDPEAALEREERRHARLKPTELIPGPAVGLPASFKNKKKP